MAQCQKLKQEMLQNCQFVGLYSGAADINILIINVLVDARRCISQLGGGEYRFWDNFDCYKSD